MRIRAWLLLCLALIAGSLVKAQRADAPGSDAMTPPDAQTALAATVLGEEVRTGDAGEMQQIVLTELFDRYAELHGVEVSDAEIETDVEAMQRGMRAKGLTAEDALPPEEAAQVEQMGRAMIRQWKLNRAL